MTAATSKMRTKKELASGCGPYSRESGYYATREEAQNDMGCFIPRDDSFNG